MYSNRIVMKLVASDWLQQSLQMTTIARKSINSNKHVIICGYGRSGQNLARMLGARGHPLHGAGPRPRPRAPGRRRRATRWCSATPRGCRR
jgi:phosphoglycerate dehydrogenase-like enzyme